MVLHQRSVREDVPIGVLAVGHAALEALACLVIGNYFIQSEKACLHEVGSCEIVPGDEHCGECNACLVFVSAFSHHPTPVSDFFWFD